MCAIFIALFGYCSCFLESTVETVCYCSMNCDYEIEICLSDSNESGSV